VGGLKQKDGVLNYGALCKADFRTVIIWNIVVKGVPYINPEGYLFLDQKRKLGLVKRIKKQIAKFGLTNEDLKIAMT